MLWLLAALLGVAALLVDTNREYPTDSPFYRMLLYTAIAINGLLFHYKPTSAVVTVDGVYSEQSASGADVIVPRFKLLFVDKIE